jgi:hypothetical protein
VDSVPMLGVASGYSFVRGTCPVRYRPFFICLIVYCFLYFSTFSNYLTPGFTPKCFRYRLW